MEVSSVQLVLLILTSNLGIGLIVIFLYWKLKKAERKIKVTRDFLARRLERRRMRVDQGTDALEMVKLTNGELHSFNLGEQQDDCKDFAVQVEMEEEDFENGSGSESAYSNSSDDSLLWEDAESLRGYQKLISSYSEMGLIELEAWV